MQWVRCSVRQCTVGTVLGSGYWVRYSMGTVLGSGYWYRYRVRVMYRYHCTGSHCTGPTVLGPTVLVLLYWSHCTTVLVSLYNCTGLTVSLCNCTGLTVPLYWSHCTHCTTVLASLASLARPREVLNLRVVRGLQIFLGSGI